MRILILGDSHTRAYAYREGIYPFFMGPGGTINLKHGKRVIEDKSNNVLAKFGLQNDDWVFFHLGEPDCRLQLGHGWHPHKLKGIKSKVNEKFLDECVSNYRQVLKGVRHENVGVIGATTAYQPAIAAVQYFNRRLQPRVSVFVDIQSLVLVDGEVREEYRDPNHTYDPIHLNSKAANLFLLELMKYDIASADDHKPTRSPFNTNDVRDDFRVSKFGSLTVKS